MTTKNIEWLIGHLRSFSGTSLAPALMHQAADTLQSQAERVKALELDLDVQAGSIEAVQTVNARQAERIKALEAAPQVGYFYKWKEAMHGIARLMDERDTLRAQLAEIEEAEPVIWAISYDGVTPYTLWHEGDGPLLDCEVKRQGGTTQKMPLFTRPMPAQIIGLQDVHDAITANPTLAQQGEPEPKLWLWKNFVDGKQEYWVFDNLYPININDDDPQTLGDPCGYALFKPSRNGRKDTL